MAGRPRNPDRDRAFELWRDSGGSAKLKDIAEQIGIPDSRIRKWKTEDNWDGKIKERSDMNKGALLNSKGSVPKRGAPKGNKNAAGHGAPVGNKNAVGNRGGPGGPVGNNKAMTHGLFATYLPAETLELAQSFAEKSPIDLLWENICIKYAAIIRAQQIMFVKSKDEIVKYLKSESENSATWEFQYPWDRQAKFLAAQSRAMGTLNNMIKQYDELLRSDLATKEQRLRVQKLKVEVDKLRGGTKEDAINKHNANISTLASMLKNPVNDRPIADFEGEGND